MSINGKHGLQDSVISLLSLLYQSALSHAHPITASRLAAKEVKPTGTLLIVDGEPAVWQLEAEILCQKGYKVLQAQSLEKALSLAREVPVIHLLITDVSMSRIDAFELSQRFRSIHPHTPVLMISSSLPLWRDGTRDLEHVVLLAKPFAFDELLEKVRMLLDAAFLEPVRKPWAHD